MSTVDDVAAQAEARIRAPFAYIPPEYRAAVERFFYDYDPDEEFVGTSYEHGDAILHLLLLIRALLHGTPHTLYQNTDFDVDVPPDIAGTYARRSGKDKNAQSAADGGAPPDDDGTQTTRPFAPDIAVVLGQQPPEDEQPSYRIGRDGHAPDIVIEVASKATATFDIESKPHVYCYVLQVPEYFVFDPRKGRRGRRRKPYWNGAQLRGWQRSTGTYREMQPNAQGRLWSDALQSWLGPDDLPGQSFRLWLWDKDGNRRMTQDEVEHRARVEAEARENAAYSARVEAEAREDAAHSARLEAEARIVQLEAELRRLRGEI